MSAMKQAINYVSKQAITRFLILQTSLRERANTGLKFGNFLKAQSCKEPLRRALKSSLEDKI